MMKFELFGEEPKVVSASVKAQEIVAKLFEVIEQEVDPIPDETEAGILAVTSAMMFASAACAAFCADMPPERQEEFIKGISQRFAKGINFHLAMLDVEKERDNDG